MRLVYFGDIQRLNFPVQSPLTIPMKNTIPETSLPNGNGDAWLEVVRQKVGNLRFGSVQITVHDGRVTQVESIEKTRFVASREEGTNGQK